MGIIQDKAEVVDRVEAGLTTEVVDPSFPCPDCGMESKPTQRPATNDTGERICSAARCRTVSGGIVEANGPKGSARFPCPAVVKVTDKVKKLCGKETKVKAVAIATHTERVCSGVSCRLVFDPDD